MNRPHRVFAWFVLSVLLTVLAPCTLAQTFSLRKEGSRLHLVSGNASLLLLEENAIWDSTDGPSEVRLRNGYVVRIHAFAPGQIDVLRNGKQTGEAALSSLLDDWIHRDIWGGFEAGVFLRGIYDHGGLCGHIFNAAADGNSALAVISWTACGGSGDAVKSQQLVRIRPAPVSVTVVRNLDLPSLDSWLYNLSPFPCRRLLVFGNRLVLFTNPGEPGLPSENHTNPPRRSKLEEIDRTGKTVRVVAHLRSDIYPIGVVSGRWLLLADSERDTGKPLRVFDISSRKARRLPNSRNAAEIMMDDASPRILLADSGYRTGPRRASIVSVPDGRQVTFVVTGRERLFLWGRFVVGLDTAAHRVSVYAASTGRPLARLTYK